MNHFNGKYLIFRKYIDEKIFFFQRYRLPTNVLHERGAVLHLSVWDKDIVNDDFIGECFVSLTNIQSLKDVASLRDVPVSEVRLRRPHKNIQPGAFEVKFYSLIFFFGIISFS
jgi:hypothetical protein